MPETRLGWHHRRLRNFDYSSSDRPYFVTIRAKSGTAPFTNNRFASEVIDAVNWMRANRGVAVYAYCLMPDHLHLLLGLPEGSSPLGTIVGVFKRYTTRVSWGHGVTGALWQQRFHDRVLRGNEDVRTVAEYILANPVRKGLCESPEEYKWSGTPDEM